MSEKENRYDRRDIIRQEALLRAGPLKLAAYRVRDPETDAFGKLQFHVTFDNCVMAVMDESSARLFCTFVDQTIAQNEVAA
jgi:hypothetical protein